MYLHKDKTTGMSASVTLASLLPALAQNESIDFSMPTTLVRGLSIQIEYIASGQASIIPVTAWNENMGMRGFAYVQRVIGMTFSTLSVTNILLRTRG